MTSGLLSRLRANDQTAWAELYDSVAADLRAYVKRLGALSPDDIVGDAMVCVVKDLPKFHGTESELRPWIFRIAHNRVVDSARRRGARVSEVSTDFGTEAFEPYMPLMSMPNLSELSGLLDTLTTDQKAAVWLRFVTNLSLEDAAAVMGKTNDAVAALTTRALRHLRAQLAL